MENLNTRLWCLPFFQVRSATGRFEQELAPHSEQDGW